MTDEASALAVMAVPPGSRVRVFGGADDHVAARLAQRDCTLASDGGEGATGEVDAAVLLGTLESTPDPIGLLQEACAAVGSGGLVIASVRNATHGALRLQLLRGRLPGGSGPALRYDSAGFQRLFGEAGLVVVDRLRVRRGLTDTEVDIDPASFKTEVLATIAEDPDAENYELVFVARAGPDSGAAPSLAEQLQHRLDQAERAAAERADYARSLEAALAEGEVRLGALDAAETELAELRLALTERMRELDLMHRQLVAVRLDVELKDAFNLEVRQLLADEKVDTDRLNMENQEYERNAVTAARLAHQLQTDLAQTHAAAAEQRAAFEAELASIKGQIGYRLVARANRIVRGRVVRGIRWAVGRARHRP